MQYKETNEDKQTSPRDQKIFIESLTRLLLFFATLAQMDTALGMRNFDWPQFHGPSRDSISIEKGLLEKWPAQGPKLLWTTQGIGEGFSTVAISEGLIYTTGNIGDYTVITALRTDGEREWTARNGPAYRREKPGARSTPTIDSGRLYIRHGDFLYCYDVTRRRSSPVPLS
ncbi:MAG: hypothetical protein JSW47_03130 [Phycisphaerales bacterium]|nr:MAG: hypothetical protein JSW47_03130 [Phycisphaerales bacterium]